MQVSSIAYATESVMTVSGIVDDVAVGELRRQLVGLLDERRADIVLDMRDVPEVHDDLIAALVVARSRAKHLRSHLVVVDHAEGATSAALRRSGMHFRIPLYLDCVSASLGLAGNREARERLALGAAPHRSPETAQQRGNRSGGPPGGSRREPASRPAHLASAARQARGGPSTP
jgi:anti-anti-sigma regulatory factor